MQINQKNPQDLLAGTMSISFTTLSTEFGLPGGSVLKSLPASAGNLSLTPGLGRSPGEGNGNPLQYSCLENPMDREAWGATVYGVARVGHNLATKPPPPIYITSLVTLFESCIMVF